MNRAVTGVPSTLLKPDYPATQKSDQERFPLSSEQSGTINDMASPLVVQIEETVTKPTISEHKLVLATSSIPVPRNVDKTKGTDTHFEVGSIALKSTEEYWQTKSGDKQISPSSKSHEISMRREDSNKNKSGTKSQKSDLGQSTHKYTIDRLCPYFFGSPFRPGLSCKWGSDCYYKHVLTIAGEVYIPQKISSNVITKKMMEGGFLPRWRVSSIQQTIFQSLQNNYFLQYKLCL